MSRQWKLALCAIPLSLWFSSDLLGEEKTSLNPREIIQEAIQATGGVENIKKFSCHRTRAKGTYYQGAAQAQITFDHWSKIPNKMRTEVVFSVEGQEVKLARVFNGNQEWFLKSDGSWREGTKSEIKDERQANIEDEARLLYPLLDKSKYKLKVIGERKISNHDCLGVQASTQGFNDILLYFDKKSSLLMKTQMRVVPRDGEKEALQEKLYSDYKSIKGGIKYATKMILLYDKKKEAELELIDIIPLDDIKDSVFEKPLDK